MPMKPATAKESMPELPMNTWRERTSTRSMSMTVTILSIRVSPIAQAMPAMTRRAAPSTKNVELRESHSR